MTDDSWRRRRRDEDDDFGPPLFGDEPTGGSSGRLSFGDDTGSLPHWSEPPTGDLPRVGDDATDDLDAWSSFSGVGSDDPTAGGFDDEDDITGLSPVFESDDTSADDSVPAYRDDLPRLRDDASPRREQSRITIGTDPTDGALTRQVAAQRRPRPGETPTRGMRPGRPAGGRPAAGRGPAPRRAPQTGGVGGRDMPTAVAVGLGLAAVFLAVLMYGPTWSVAVVVVLVLFLAAVEYFDRVRERNYQPAFLPGVMACAMAPVAVYHYGVGALALVMVLAFAAAAASFIGATGLDSNPMPNMAISMLGITWIGALGSFGGAIVALSNTVVTSADGPLGSVGTDTLCLLAVGVVANDVGALFVGSKVGRTPLRYWISPNKSIEGFIGGTLATLGAMFLVDISGRSQTWNGLGDLLLLGLVISVTAPLGDLTESMFKRNLDVKDFGNLIKGHGGVLDRFDGFLFTLPAVYYLTVALQPWVTA